MFEISASGVSVVDSYLAIAFSLPDYLQSRIQMGSAKLSFKIHLARVGNSPNAWRGHDISWYAHQEEESLSREQQGSLICIACLVPPKDLGKLDQCETGSLLSRATRS